MPPQNMPLWHKNYVGGGVIFETADTGESLKQS